MSLFAGCSSGFTPRERSRGAFYYQRGAVKNLRVQGARATATVRGSMDYDVTIDWSDVGETDEVVGQCTCPYYEGRGTCKHLWAMILALDVQGKTAHLPSTCHLVDDFSAALALKAKSAESVRAKPLKPRAAPKKAPPKPPPPPTWKAELASLGGGSSSGALLSLWQAEVTQRRVLYAIDVPASQARGEIVIRLLQEERKRDGDYGKPTKLTLDDHAVHTFSTTPDGPMLDWLNIVAKDIAGGYGYGYNRWGTSGKTAMAIPARVLPQLLPQLARAGRLVWGLDPQPPINPGDLHAVAWDGDAPWHLEIDVAADDQAHQWSVRGHLVRESEAVGLPVSHAVLTTSQVILWPDRIGLMRAGESRDWLNLLRRREQFDVPYADRAAFLKQFYALPAPPVVHLPEDSRPAAARVAPRGHLLLRKPAYARHKQEELDVLVSFDYEYARVRWHEGRMQIYDDKANRLISRDIDAERQLLGMLTGLGFTKNPGYADCDMLLQTKLLAQVVQKLPLESWIVEAEGKLIRRPGTFDLSVTSGVDWFELDGACDFDGKSVSLPEILAAARKGEKFVRLGDGSQGILPQEWLDKFGKFIDLAQEKDGKLQFKPTQAMLLDALLAEQGSVQVDRGFAAYREKLKTFAGIEAAAPPKGFIGDLRPYQRDGLGWLEFLKEFQFGGCLADDMGLGKTVQVLALLEQRRSRRLKKDEARLPSVVVVPRSLIFNWQNEAAKFAPKLKVLDFSSIARQQLWEQLPASDVVLMTYGTLIRDIMRLKDQAFDYAILDEAQAIKNSGSQSAKACRLLNARHRLALTGTPIENHLGELWSLIEFLNPGMLGKFATFAKLADSNKSPEEAGEGRTLISKAVQPIILRRTKQQVLKDLPEKTEQTIVCELTPAERKKYNEVRDYYRASLTKQIDDNGLEKSKIHVLEALLRLRQSACHLGLLDDKLKSGSSAKLDVLFEQVDEIIQEKHKALIFSQFTELLGIVREHLDRRKVTYEYLDGKTRDRQQRVDRFQTDPDCPLFLVSLKAGGRGLNLTAADYVFILDPWWNPAVEAQAVDRAHRIGQTRPVFAYRLIAKDTVEEKILELQKSKRDLAESIISADSSVLKNLTAEDLKLLLG